MTFTRERKPDVRPLAVDLFAGAGGMSLGFEQAGFDVCAAVEIDPIHCAVHKFNFPNSAVLAASVQTVSGHDIRERAGLGDRPIDCVFGGPPCQGFSLIGQRVLDDPRNRLVLDFVRIVRELDARTFVFENVKGLTVGKHRRFLGELVAAFQAAGYEVRLPWMVLNAGNFGVPQSRERFILMGVKKGGQPPDYPPPTTNIAGRLPNFPALPFGPTCKDAIGDLPDAEAFDALLHSDAVRTSDLSSPSPYAARLRGMNNDSWGFGYVRAVDSGLLTSSARTDHTDISRRRFHETAPGSVEPISRFFRLPPDGVSNTLRAGTDGARGAFTSPRPIHYMHVRCITVREMARLHGFPDWFRFHATKWHGARQIGNAVPPPLARVIAAQVLGSLELLPKRPQGILPLGDPALLSLDSSHAAAFFGVNGPNTRRDRRSGATKRKQSEIEASRTSLVTAHS
jgi:DNA (cytosine-5)-methyltransferase 1